MFYVLHAIYYVDALYCDMIQKRRREIRKQVVLWHNVITLDGMSGVMCNT